jgi:hypothetical protein
MRIQVESLLEEVIRVRLQDSENNAVERLKFVRQARGNEIKLDVKMGGRFPERSGFVRGIRIEEEMNRPFPHHLTKPGGLKRLRCLPLAF